MPKSTRLEEQCRDIASTIEYLLSPAGQRGLTVLGDMLRRAEEPFAIDGYPRGSGGEPTSGGGVSDPTLGSVIAREADTCDRCEQGIFTLSDGRLVLCRACGGTGRRFSDPVGEAVREITSLVRQIWRLARQIERRRQTVSAEVNKRGRESSVQSCAICGDTVTGVGNDRLRLTWDSKCYLSWTSWQLRNKSSGDPGTDRIHFAQWRRESLAKKNCVCGETSARNCPVHSPA